MLQKIVNRFQLNTQHKLPVISIIWITLPLVGIYLFLMTIFISSGDDDFTLSTLLFYALTSIITTAFFALILAISVGVCRFIQAIMPRYIATIVVLGVIIASLLSFDMFSLVIYVLLGIPAAIGLGLSAYVESTLQKRLDKTVLDASAHDLLDDNFQK